jgi:lipopolysaccharide transport system ATP-binding protein
MSLTILEVSGVSKKFCRNPHKAVRYFLGDIGREILGNPPSSLIREDEFWALRDVSFSLHQGEVLGVIGHNGAGKSTLINLIAGLIRPTNGKVSLHVNRVALMDHGGGLNSSLSGRENLRNQLALHGCPSVMIPTKEEAIIEFAEIGAFIDAPVGTYSLGMRQRLAFSIFTQIDPDLFIVDEALNGGDLRFRQKFALFLKEYVGRGGSILLCSHELHAIQMLCPRSILLDHGKLISCGNTTEVIDEYHRMQSPCAGDEPLQSSMRLEVDTPRDISAEQGDTVTITSVASQNTEAGSMISGSDIDLTITAHSPDAQEDVFWVVEFGNETSDSLATITLGYPPETVFLKAGKNRVICRIKSLPFAAGAYQVRVYLMQKDIATPMATFGLDNPPYTFEVKKALDPMSNMQAYRKNIVHLQPDWSFED